MLINNKAPEKFCPDPEVIHVYKEVEHLRGWQTEDSSKCLSEHKQGSKRALLGVVSHHHPKDVVDVGE